MLAASNSSAGPGSAIEAALFLFFSILVIFFFHPLEIETKEFSKHINGVFISFLYVSSKYGLDYRCVPWTHILAGIKIFGRRYETRSQVAVLEF